MKIIENEMTVFFDIDNTLVMWDDNFYTPIDGRIEINDPYDNANVYLTPHKIHIKCLKEHKERGFHVIVWSAAGYRWAEAVVKALGLEQYVDHIMTKPTKHFDDLPTSEIMGQRVYIKP